MGETLLNQNRCRGLAFLNVFAIIQNVSASKIASTQTNICVNPLFGGVLRFQGYPKGSLNVVKGRLY